MSALSSVRRSTIRGAWYPGDAKALRWMIESFMANVPEQALDGELLALISPHAGYQFSGQTAAHGYKQIVGRRYDAVIVVGPSHFALVGDFAVSAEEAYETPFGQTPLAQNLIDELNDWLPVHRVREPWQIWGEWRWEHSLEMQLPFLQYALGEFALLPILMSADALEPCVGLGQALARLMRGRNILLVASSDLNHIESYSEVVQRDAEVIRAIERFDVQAMADVLLDPAYTVCGRAPILAATAAAQALGATRVQVLNYTNSGNVSGRKAEGIYTVGYLSAALLRSNSQ